MGFTLYLSAVKIDAMDDMQILAIGGGVTLLVLLLNFLGFISLPLIVRQFIKPKAVKVEAATEAAA